MYNTFLHTTFLENEDKDFLTIWIVNNRIDNNLLEDDLKRYFKKQIVPENVYIIHPCTASITENEVFIRRIDYLKNTIIKFIPFTENGSFSIDADIVEILKEKAIIDLFNKNNVMMTFNQDYHFQTLSGKHTDKFIKVSNLLINQNEIDFLSICLLKFLGYKNIYVDTSTIISLIQACLLLRKEMNGAFNIPRIYNFHSYEKEQDYLSNLQLDGQIIISTTTTATLVDTIKKHNRNLTDILVLFYYPVQNTSHSFQNLITLSEENIHEKPPKNYKAENCELCKRGSIPLQLISEQFILEVKKPEPVKLTVFHQSKNMASFFKKYVTKGILVFGGKKSGKPKFEFNIDIEKLTNNQEFIQKLEYIMKRHFSFSIKKIIITDQSSKILADKVNAILLKVNQTNLPIFSINEFFNENTIFTQDESILILAGSINSGYALEEISRQLRITHPNSSRFYIIGINKQYSNESFNIMKNNLDKNHMYNQSHLVLDVDSILLPTKTNFTTWDKELELLKEISVADSGGFSHIQNADIDERIKILESMKEEARSSNIFWKATDGSELMLEDGFAFWPFYKKNEVDQASQVDVLFTFASVLQYARISKKELQKDGRDNLEQTPYNQKLLAPENFARFNDGILQASLLRLAKNNELNYSTTLELSRTMAHMIEKIIKKHKQKQGESAMEFLIALGTQHLKLHTDDFANLKNSLSPMDDYPEYMQIIIKYVFK